MEDLLEKKYPARARALIWLWCFPVQALTCVSADRAYRRDHRHEGHVQKAIKEAVCTAKLLKRASAHTVRHSLATHLLQAHDNIRTIQARLGHGDVRTTMIIPRPSSARPSMRQGAHLISDPGLGQYWDRTPE